nr:F0F1 ATP synthase subunit B [Desulfofalx alkaliphila]
MTLLAQIFNFIVLLIFLRLVVWKPLIRLIDNRREKIGEDVAAAENSRQEAEKIRMQLNADLAKAREEAQAIIQRATKTAEDEAAQIIENAKTEANRVKDNALQDIEREREKAVVELRKEVAGLSILVASKVVSDKITDELHEDLVEKYVDEAGKLPC